MLRKPWVMSSFSLPTQLFFLSQIVFAFEIQQCTFWVPDMQVAQKIDLTRKSFCKAAGEEVEKSQWTHK